MSLKRNRLWSNLEEDLAIFPVRTFIICILKTTTMLYRKWRYFNVTLMARLCNNAMCNNLNGLTTILFAQDTYSFLYDWRESCLLIYSICLSTRRLGLIGLQVDKERKQAQTSFKIVIYVTLLYHPLES